MRALLIILAVLILVVVGVDVGGRALAESKAGEAIAMQAGSSVAPTVDIHGFSFLIQALPGNYDSVTVTQNDLTVGPFAPVSATVHLHNVSYPLSSALDGTVDGLTAGRAELQVMLPVEDLGTALQVSGLTLSQGAEDSFRLSAELPVGGTQVPITADLSVAFADDQLTLRASNLAAAGFTLPNVEQLTQALNLTVPLSALPIPITAARLGVNGDQLQLTATAINLSASVLR